MKSLSLGLCALWLLSGLFIVGCENKPAPPPDDDKKQQEEDKKKKADAEKKAIADAKKAEKPAPTTETLNVAKSKELGSIKNLSVCNTYWLAGQPTEGDVEILKKQQIQMVINLRMTEEDLGFDEAKALEEAGIKYTNPSFNSPETMTDEKINEIRKLLRDTNNQPMLLHCASANRVGAVWMIYRVLDEGWDYDQALKEAKTIVGLRSEALEKRAKEYIDKHNASDE